MDHEFKPGDLALIVGAFVLKENIGKTCQLDRLVQTGEIYTAPDGNRFQHDGVPCWITLAPSLAVRSEDEVFFQGWGLSVPQHLMPLKGAAEPTEVRQAERVQ